MNTINDDIWWNVMTNKTYNYNRYNNYKINKRYKNKHKNKNKSLKNLNKNSKKRQNIKYNLNCDYNEYTSYNIKCNYNKTTKQKKKKRNNNKINSNINETNKWFDWFEYYDITNDYDLLKTMNLSSKKVRKIKQKHEPRMIVPLKTELQPLTVKLIHINSCEPTIYWEPKVKALNNVYITVKLIFVDSFKWKHHWINRYIYTYFIMFDIFLSVFIYFRDDFYHEFKYAEVSAEYLDYNNDKKLQNINKILLYSHDNKEIYCKRNEYLKLYCIGNYLIRSLYHERKYEYRFRYGTLWSQEIYWNTMNTEKVTLKDLIDNGLINYNIIIPNDIVTIISEYIDDSYHFFTATIQGSIYINTERSYLVSEWNEFAKRDQHVTLPRCHNDYWFYYLHNSQYIPICPGNGMNFKKKYPYKCRNIDIQSESSSSNNNLFGGDSSSSTSYDYDSSSY